MGVAETHLNEGTLQALCKANSLGLQSYWTKAQPTGKGGTHGGTAILADCRLDTTSADAMPGASSSCPHALPYVDFTPILWRIGAVVVLIVQVYMDHG